MEFLVPILALSIPIVAIIARTYAKVHQNDTPKASREILALEERINNLEKDNLRMEEEIRQLEDKQKFLTRLLEDKN